MKVIDLLEKADMNDLEFIDIFSEDEDGLCCVLHLDRWREFLPEKVLNWEVFKFSPNDTSSEPGLNIYIKDEETCKDVYKDKFEKKHDDSVDSLVFAVKELNKVGVQHEPFMNEIEEIIKNNPDTVIQVTFGGSKICVMVYSNYLRATNFKNLSLHASVKDILDAIKDLVRSVKEKEDKQNGCMD